MIKLMMNQKNWGKKSSVFALLKRGCVWGLERWAVADK